MEGERGDEEARRCRLYLITPAAFDLAVFRDDLARALDAGDVAAVQLRLKDVAEDELKRAIEILRPVAQAREVAFLLNDRPDLVRESGADGAHVGAGDMDVAEARRLLGPDFQLGASCYASRDRAMQAGEAGADYVAFGAFFPTLTKQAPARAAPEILTWWTELMEIPAVAIGGIEAGNCAPLVQAGADFLAVVSAVWQHPEGPAAGVRALNAAIKTA